jgi:hypothetical protein
MISLLKFKHWQIFMLTFGILIIALLAQAVAMAYFEDLTLTPRFVSLVAVAATIFNCCWTYILGTKLNEKHPVVKFNQQSFTTSIILSSGISIFHNVVLPELDAYNSRGFNGGLNIATLGFGLYLDYWVAKLLRSVELDREARGSEFTGDFFSFLFLPIGVWWLQPRINKIFNDEGDAYDPDAPLDQHVKM